MPTLSIMLVGPAERRTMIKGYLSRMPEWQIAGEVDNMSSLRLVTPLAPDVVLVDSASTTVNPLGAISMLAELEEAPQVVALMSTGSVSERTFFLALGAQAVARLEQPDTLMHALEVVEEEVALARNVPTRLRDRLPAVAPRYDRAA